MNVVFITAAVIASLCVLAVLVIGLVSMVKGGEFNKKHGNKLMRARLYLQGLALIMLALAYFTSQN